MRSGTLDVPGVAAFALAVEIAVKEQADRAEWLRELRDDLVARVLDGRAGRAAQRRPHAVARTAGCPATRTSPSPTARATRC